MALEAFLKPYNALCEAKEDRLIVASNIMGLYFDESIPLINPIVCNKKLFYLRAEGPNKITMVSSDLEYEDSVFKSPIRYLLLALKIAKVGRKWPF